MTSYLRWLLCFSALALLCPPPAQGCTLYASYLGAVPFAGKIRDTKAHHQQILKVQAPNLLEGELWSYLGLFAADGPESITFSPLKMGVNEHGLFIGFSTPSSLPPRARREQPFFKDLTHHLLTRARSVSEAQALLESIQVPLGARIMLLADARHSLLLENGFEGPLNFSPAQLATNHFQHRALRHLNVRDTENSKERLKLAEQLFAPLSFADAGSTHAVLDGLWVPRSESSHTRSDFTVHYPPGMGPRVSVRVENEGRVTVTEAELKAFFGKKLSYCSAF